MPAPPVARSSPRPAPWKTRGGERSAPPVRGRHAPGDARGTKAAASPGGSPGSGRGGPPSQDSRTPPEWGEGTEVVTCPARAPRDGSGMLGFRVRSLGVQSLRVRRPGALAGPGRRLPASPRGRCLYLRGAAAPVRSAGRGRGRREGALTAASPVGTPPAACQLRRKSGAGVAGAAGREPEAGRVGASADAGSPLHPAPKVCCRRTFLEGTERSREILRELHS